MKNYLLILFLTVVAFSGSSQTYVTADGNGDGSSWDSPTSISNALTGIGLGTLTGPIYMKEGTYTGSNLDLPSSDVVIEGGYPATLSGTSLCGQDPVNKKTILQGSSGNDGTFFITGPADGNLSLSSVTFTGVGRLLTVDGQDNASHTFDEVMFTGVTGGIAGKGIVYVEGNGSGNTITFNTLNSEGNTALTYSTQVGTSLNDLVINDSYIANNNTGLDRAGAIFIEGLADDTDGNTATINTTTFCSNSADGAGAILVDDGTTLDLNPGTVFYLNSNTASASDNGGAIHAEDNSIVTSDGVIYYGNTAAGNGGAAEIIGGSTFTSTGDVFDTNSAGGEGGAVFIDGGEFTSTGTQYNNNTLTGGGDGGAIRLEGSTFTSTDDDFIGNSSPSGTGDGGAISVNGTDGTNGTIDIQIVDAQFYDNESGDNGGAIDLLNTAETDVLIQNSEFLSNTAAADGGAIKSQGSDLHVEGSRFEGNTGTYGGAIKTAGNVSLWVNGTDSWFKNNTSRENGGAIEINGDEFDVWGTGYGHTIDNTVFYGNTAGAATNTADDGGGAIYITNATTPNSITNSEFYNNETTVTTANSNGGGAIYLNDSNINNFDNNTFGGNVRIEENFGSLTPSTTETNANGGSDIKSFFAEVQNISNSTMQLAAQTEYDGDFSFDTGNTFGGAAPTDPGSLTAPTAATVDTTCPAKTPEQTIMGNLPADPTLMTTCGATADIVMSSLNDLGEMDNAYTYTWKDPSNIEVATGTANAEGDFELSGITKVGTYTLEITDSKGCEITETIDVAVTDCPSILPVELKDFKAQYKNGDVLLTWATASEVNNSHFMIERSIDGKRFDAIGKVYGNGTSLDVNKYDFLDKDPYSGTSYYRLMQVDYDGSFAYSNPVAVEVRAGSFKVYPNPAMNFINVDYPDQNAVVYIYDVFGKVIAQENTGRINLDNMLSGTYLLKIVSNTGDVLESKIFTVQK